MTPLDGAYCNALLLAQWSIGQKLTMSVQFSSVMSLCNQLTHHVDDTDVTELNVDFDARWLWVTWRQLGVTWPSQHPLDLITWQLYVIASLRWRHQRTELVWTCIPITDTCNKLFLFASYYASSSTYSDAVDITKTYTEWFKKSEPLF